MPTASNAGLPATSAWNMSGYCVAEWLPQIVIVVTSLTGSAALAASWAMARLWSSRVMAVNRRGSTSGGVVLGDQGVRVGRVADDEDPDVVGGAGGEGLALGS